MSVSMSASDDDAATRRIRDDDDKLDKSDHYHQHHPQQQQQKRRRLLKTVALFFCCFAIGLEAVLVGITVLHVSVLYETTVAAVSWLFTFSAAGCATGALAAGLLMHRLHYEFSFSVLLLVRGLAVAAAPWFHHLYAFIAIYLLIGILTGFFLCGAHPYCVETWRGHRYQQAVMQAMHATWSVATIIGPLITRLFLVELADEMTVPDRSAAGDGGIAWQSISSNSTSADYSVTESTVDSVPELTLVRYAYLTIGLLGAVSAVPVAGLYLSSATLSPWLSMGRQHTADSSAVQQSSSTRSSRTLTAVYLALLFSLSFLHAVTDRASRTFLLAFAVRQLGWTVHSGASLTAVLNAGFFVGRLVGIPLSTVVRPRRILLLNGVLTTVGFALMCLAALGAKMNSSSSLRQLTSPLAWVSAAVAGLGMSTLFPTMFLCAADTAVTRLPVLSATLDVGGNSAMAVSLLAVGWMLDSWSAAWLAYVCTAASVLFGVVLLAMRLFDSVWKQRQLVSTADEVDVPLRTQSSDATRHKTTADTGSDGETVC